jgi:NADH-quinone oxidoreductase subunit N
MIIGSLGGLWQTDVKRMMAYSGISQSGYILMGLSIGSIAGYQALFIQLIAYIFAVIGIFAVISHLTTHEDLTDLSEYRGLYHRSPILAFTMLISLISLTGIPGTAGFIGKLSIISASLEAGYLWFVLLAMISTVITFGYYWKIIRTMWLESSTIMPSVKPQTSTIPVVVTSLVVIVGIGLYPDMIFRVVTAMFPNI